MTRIAYQGELGSNSAAVCELHYPDAATLPCASFEDAFAAVTSGSCDLAVIPVDNSVAGRVAEIHRQLPDSGLRIVAEHFLRVRFHLVAVPGATTESLRTVHSHVHAFGQCRKVIRELRLDAVVAGDTAGAAREVATAGDPTRGAITTATAASAHGLVVLRSDVEDETHNTTRFVVLAVPGTEPAAGDGPHVTSLVFDVDNRPAALFKALGGFATNGVNMTKLESYMVDGAFVATRFLAEVDGRPDEPGLRRALEEVTYFATSLIVLGAYPADPFRRRRLSPVSAVAGQTVGEVTA